MSIDEFQFGILGSIVYVGNAVGAATAAYFLSASDKVKYTLSLTILLNSGCLFAFAKNTNFYLAILLRFITGFL